MKAVRFARHAFNVVAALALLAGCNANGNAPPLSGSVVPANVRGLPARQRPIGHSWMRKPPKGTTGTIWATDIDYASVDVIAYPSATLIGQVAGFSYPYGDCSDKNGNVYVADFSFGEGFEIQAGTTKIINSWSTGETLGCSVSDGGDVAFTAYYPSGVWIFPNGGASGTFYAEPVGIAGYDPHGNLFAVCSNSGQCSSPRLAELPAGGNNWKFLNLNETLYFPGAVQNMGKYLGIAASNGRDGAGIALVAVSGSNATVKKTIVLNGEGCSSYMDDPSSWGSVSKQSNGVIATKIKRLIAPNLWCFPSPINIYKVKGGDPIGSITVEPSQYDYGVTFTKP